MKYFHTFSYWLGLTSHWCYPIWRRKFSRTVIGGPVKVVQAISRACSALVHVGMIPHLLWVVKCTCKAEPSWPLISLQLGVSLNPLFLYGNPGLLCLCIDIKWKGNLEQFESIGSSQRRHMVPPQSETAIMTLLHISSRSLPGHVLLDVVCSVTKV